MKKLLNVNNLLKILSKMILYNKKIHNVYNLLKILSRIILYYNKILKRLGLKNKKYNKKKKNFNKKFHT